MSTVPGPEIELAPGVAIGPGRLPVIAGPCVIESDEQVMTAARAVAGLAERLGVDAVFKASYDKANRSSIESFRGPGLERGLESLARVRADTGLPILTDIHEPAHCAPAAEVCAVLQIPAFLCRQTDLIVAAAETGQPVNVKKGQFMAPADMRQAVAKARSTGNEAITVTERGTLLGYNNLVVDMRSFSILADLGVPVIYDVTHSLQLPGGPGRETGGQRRFAEPLARAAVAAGAAGLYLEVHPDPANALSDSTTQLDPERAERLLEEALAVHRSLATVAGSPA